MTTTNTTRTAAGRKLNRSQKLLTAEQARRLPALYSTDGQGDKATVWAKFFLGAFTWYATEFNAETGTFFGLVDNVNMRDQEPEGELGYFTAEELCTITAPVHCIGNARFSFRQPVERDIHFTPCTLGEIRDKLNPSRKARRELSAADAAAVAEFDAAEVAEVETVFADMVEEARNGYPTETETEEPTKKPATAADRFAAGYARIKWGR
jgi:hypothetical protein